MAFRRPITRLEQIPNVAASGVADGETLVHDTTTGNWVAGTGTAPPEGTVNRTRYGPLGERPAADANQGIWFDTETTPPTQYLDTGAWHKVRELPNGTAGAPALAFASDPDTGLYRVGADEIAIATGGTARLQVVAGGLRPATDAAPALGEAGRRFTDLFLSGDVKNAAGAAKYAMSLISDTVLGADTTTVTLNNIPQTFKNLILIARLRGSLTGAAGDTVHMQVNGLTTGYRYRLQNNAVIGTVTSSASSGASAIPLMDASLTRNDYGNWGMFRVEIPDYSAVIKRAFWATGYGAHPNVDSAFNCWASLYDHAAAAITRMDFFLSGGQVKTGSRFMLYGVN